MIESAISFYVYKFQDLQLSVNPADWGAFGDYVGGLVNPAAGVATVILVFFTLAVQRIELRASLRELKIANTSAALMSFEQSLFAWLSNYHSLINAIEAQVGTTGRKAMSHWYQSKLSPRKVFSPVDNYHPIIGPVTDFSVSQYLIRINVPNEGINQVGSFLKMAIISYQKIYQANRMDLDAPFRTLFRLIRWIDESNLTAEKKWHYVALVRAQLSWIEQVFLFYNCLTKEGSKMAIYANRYALFDNLVGGDELIRFATQEFTNCTEGERPKVLDGDISWPFFKSAFSSKEAKFEMQLPEST